MKIKILLILLCLSVCSAKAQTDVRLRITEGVTDSALIAKIEGNTSRFLTEIRNAFFEERQLDFSGVEIAPDAVQVVLDMWNISIFNSSVSELERKCIKRYDGGWQIRDIPIIMLAEETVAENDRKQEIVINFTAEGAIDDINILGSEHRTSEIITSGDTVRNLVDRQRILDFVEKFRTAYNTKNLKYLDTFYSDDALIITGKFIKKALRSDQVGTLQIQNDVEYITQSKPQYFRKLTRIFSAIKYINIDFREIEIHQHPLYRDLYGVTLKQYWNTDIYSDVGFLFLTVDCKDIDKMIIHFRAWQPSEYNGKELSRDERFRITKFNITR
jgi:hypothetical protein